MHTSIAADPSALKVGAVLRIIPAGPFRAYDGRPKDVSAWRLDAAGASAIIAGLRVRQAPYVIDYEHQTLNKTQNGQPAPAAGWFDGVEWREGDGLYLTGIKWTVKASAMIAAHEYRYLSPVLNYNGFTGAVTGLHSVALTNDPALVGLSDLAAASGQAVRSQALSNDLAPGQRMSASDRQTFMHLTGMDPWGELAEDRPALCAFQALGLTADEACIAAAMGLSPRQFVNARAA